MSNLSKNLTHYRQKADLSHNALAKKTGLSKSSISRWEAADSFPSVDAIIKLCKSLGITTDALLLSKGEASSLNSSNKSLANRLKRIEKLSIKEQNALFSIIDAYLKSNT